MTSDLDSRAFAAGTWLVLAVLLAAAVYLAAVERWLGVGVLGATIVLSLLFVRLQYLLPRLFNLLFVLAGALNAGAYVFNLWDRISPYDEFVHLYTTFAIAAAFGTLGFDRRYGEGPGLWRFVAAVTMLGFGIGVLWEVFEWAIGIIGDTVDTLVDLIMDTIGAALAGLFCAWAANQRRGGTGRRRPAAAKGPAPRARSVPGIR